MKHTNNEKTNVSAPYGRDRLMMELSPLMEFKIRDGSISIAMINNDILKSREKEMNTFLMLSDFYFIASLDSDDPSIYPRSPEENDPLDEYIPDFNEFINSVENMLNNPSTDPQRVKDIVHNLYESLYDDNDLKQISFRKAQYLTDTLSSVLNIQEAADGDPTHIAISGVNPETISDLFNDYQDMLIELGFLPFSGFPDRDPLMNYLEEYINSGVYYNDGFSFGEAVLRAYDQNIKQIDWFSHTDD